MPAAAAGHTARSTGSAVNGPFSQPGLCAGFTVNITRYQSWTETDLFASNGSLVKAEVQVVEYVDLAANGVTLTSDPTHYAASLVFDSQGNPASWTEHGLFLSIHLPDDTLAHVAGSTDVLSDSFVGVDHLGTVCAFLH
jgi:hypothetical protein